jgi:hypothetical protein
MEGLFREVPQLSHLPQQIAGRGSSAAILGHTTGSHLRLREKDERKGTLIWLVDTRDAYVTRWKLIEDNAANRGAWGLGGLLPRNA